MKAMVKIWVVGVGGDNWSGRDGLWGRDGVERRRNSRKGSYQRGGG